MFGTRLGRAGGGRQNATRAPALNSAAVKKAILAIAHTLLKIAYQVLRSGKPYEDPGADFADALRSQPDADDQEQFARHGVLHVC